MAENNPNPTPNPSPEPTPNPNPTPNSPTPPTPEPPKPDVAIGNDPEPKPNEPAAADEPITYESLTLPEGLSLDAEAPLSKSFLEIINDPKLSRAELAQRLVDLQANSVTEASERGSREFTEMVSGWRQQLKDDPEIGGANEAETLREANRVVNSYGTPGLKQALVTSGLGNHPEFARFLRKIAPMISEPKPVNAGGPKPNGAAPTVDNLYP